MLNTKTNKLDTLLLTSEKLKLKDMCPKYKKKRRNNQITKIFIICLEETFLT